ncbi:MAG TPA: hypothetical protein VGH64_06150, partial [Puia sp.]
PYNDCFYLGGGIGLQMFCLKTHTIKRIFNGQIINLGIAADYIYFRAVKWDKNREGHDKTYIIKLDSLISTR